MKNSTAYHGIHRAEHTRMRTIPPMPSSAIDDEPDDHHSAEHGADTRGPPPLKDEEGDQDPGR